MPLALIFTIQQSRDKFALTGFQDRKSAYFGRLMTSDVSPLITHNDGLIRCPWPGVDPLYVAYHDDEWGVEERDSRALFEKLLLDGFQAGLSWITILRKREAFREAFRGFDPQKVAKFDSKRVAELMENKGIVRNRAKIEGAVRSAQSYLDMLERGQDFSAFLWGFVDGKPIVNTYATLAEIPAETPVAVKLSKELRKRGFSFVGPKIVYAFMQAVGMVNDHLVTCYRHPSA